MPPVFKIDQLIMLPVTEVISDLRLQAYQNVAATLGGLVTVEVVANPSETMLVREPDGFRPGNQRDRGTFLGLMGVGVTEVPVQRRVRQIIIAEGHKGVVVNLPATYDPSTLRKVSDFWRRDFYTDTNNEYDRLRAARRAQTTAATA